jgi:lactate dehydrogenase-like 2-hydroxyacid dehydrogenase
MNAGRSDVLLLGPRKKLIVDGLQAAFAMHHALDPDAAEPMMPEIASRIRGIAISGPPGRAPDKLMQRLPKLEIVSSFGVGYDHVDAKWAGSNGVVVTNTPDVLNEEVADTALGLLLCTVRELPHAERYLRQGRWAKEGDYRLTPSLRDRTAGIVGLGRIGKAIARRLDALRMPVVYHSRRPQPDVSYRHYPKLVEMARDVDVLIVITPGGAETRNLINADVLKALGANGVLINLSRGSVVDEPALIKALQDKTILSAGLDVFANEPNVPAELLALDNVVLLPHVGSASQHTRRAMEQLVVDNLLAWSRGDAPLTPVPETPWPVKRKTA